MTLFLFNVIVIFLTLYSHPILLYLQQWQLCRALADYSCQCVMIIVRLINSDHAWVIIIFSPYLTTAGEKFHKRLIYHGDDQ